LQGARESSPPPLARFSGVRDDLPTVTDGGERVEKADRATGD
jgi:hypothetical protein